MARYKSPEEIASDIGAKAFDLLQHGDRTAVASLLVVAQVNPETLAWLRDRLLDITKQPTEVAEWKRSRPSSGHGET